MRLSGSITALATPFTVAGGIDLDAWQRLLQGQLDAGTHAVVVAGSTGESWSLADGERDALIRSAVELVAERIPVLAGTGTSSTAGTIEQTRRAAALGVDAALVVVPPYARATQAGLLAHFNAVADDGDLPIVLYNVPARTGCDLLPGTVAELAGHERIIGIKAADTSPARMQALLALRSEGFSILGGDDATALRALLAGADGVVSVASNVVPKAFHVLCELALAGHQGDAEAWNHALQGVVSFLGVEPNPIPLKSLLERLGIGHGLRLPLTPLSPAHESAAARVHGEIIELERSSRELAAA